MADRRIQWQPPLGVDPRAEPILRDLAATVHDFIKWYDSYIAGEIAKLENLANEAGGTGSGVACR
jgi:hypothetical protein